MSLKDTVAANEEDDEVNADDHAGEDGAAICHNAVVHHHIPVLACQDLHTRLVFLHKQTLVQMKNANMQSKLQLVGEKKVKSACFCKTKL